MELSLRKPKAEKVSAFSCPTLKNDFKMALSKREAFQTRTGNLSYLCFIFEHRVVRKENV